MNHMVLLFIRQMDIKSPLLPVIMMMREIFIWLMLTGVMRNN